MKLLKKTLANKIQFAVEEVIENESIDEVLRWLIQESDLDEVISMLHFIALEDDKIIKMFDNKGNQIYPNVSQ